MLKQIAIGIQNFEELIEHNYFYIDIEICCHDFAFNSQTGKFITDKKQTY